MESRAVGGEPEDIDDQINPRDPMHTPALYAHGK